MKILAIETSCDETAIALVEARGDINKPRFKILKNLVASQIKIHRPYGGVVPNLAKREHIKNLPILLKKILSSTFAKSESPEGLFHILNSLDLIAVTVGPGLEPALWTGINFAEELYKKLKIKNPMPTGRQAKLKIIGVSHLDGHLYSSFLNPKSPILYPAISLIISGGHTILLLMKDSVNYKKLGETRDDAVGECFDKVARLLNLPYPGGPEIEKLAKLDNSTSINFPRPMINQKNYDFSFSGLKTSVLYYLRDNKNVKIENVAASFELAAFDVLIYKTIKAAKEFECHSIIISGGVAANKTLQSKFKSEIKNKKLKINFLAPPKNFCTDNGAMIAAAGYINYLRGRKYKLKAQGNLSL